MLAKWKAYNKHSSTDASSISCSTSSSSVTSQSKSSKCYAPPPPSPSGTGIGAEGSVLNLSLSSMNHRFEMAMDQHNFPPPPPPPFHHRQCGSRPPSIVLVPSNLSSSSQDESSMDEEHSAVYSYFSSGSHGSRRKVSIPSDSPSVANFQQVLLLAQEDDEKYLSPIHCFVRKNIEVFTATAQSISEPAPGRKNKIRIGHVGLRCVHCGIQPPSQRVKRAVVYPSSIARIYSQVSDMKVDHFEKCKFMPVHLKETFRKLKLNKKSERKGKSLSSEKGLNNSMSRYYLESTVKMGMEDSADGGVRIRDCNDATMKHISQTQCKQTHMKRKMTMVDSPTASKIHSMNETEERNSSKRSKKGDTQEVASPCSNMSIQYKSQVTQLDLSASVSQCSSTNVSKPCSPDLPASVATLDDSLSQSNFSSCTQPLSTNFPFRFENTGSADPLPFLLASSDDRENLSELHCFVRKNIELFVATKHDVGQPQPGRRTPILCGQIGLRCIHCKTLPVRQRKKRAVCYPPNISGIYHCVSNMKFDHFSVCHRMPFETKKKFDFLVSNMARRSKLGLKSGSTSQYYIASAKKRGLVDTNKGIRFVRNQSESKSDSPDINMNSLLALAVAATYNQPVSLEDASRFPMIDHSRLLMTKIVPEKGLSDEIDSNHPKLSPLNVCSHIDYSKLLVSNITWSNATSNHLSKELKSNEA